jgi:Sulfotransferase family
MFEPSAGNSSGEKSGVNMRLYEPSRPVAFMHIQKTGGNSLSEALSGALKPRAAFGAFDRFLFGDFADFESMSEESRSKILFTSRDLPPNLDFLVGHMSFSAMSQAYPRAQFITVLREPMSRLISLWLFSRSTTDRYLEPWGKWADVVRQSHQPLKEFLRARSLACATDNVCVRMLLWPHPLLRSSDFIDPRDDETLLEEARCRLKHFCFVDLLENPELVTNLQNWLGRPLVLHRLNETNNIPDSLKSPMAAELDSETQGLIESHSRLDLRLWLEVAGQRMPEGDARVLRDQIIAANLSNFSRLMGN